MYTYNKIKHCRKLKKKKRKKLNCQSSQEVTKRFPYNLGCLINRTEPGSEGAALSNSRSSVGKLSIRRRRKNHSRSITVEWVNILFLCVFRSKHTSIELRQAHQSNSFIFLRLITQIILTCQFLLRHSTVFRKPLINFSFLISVHFNTSLIIVIYLFLS